VRVLGIDLASQPLNTGAVMLEASDGVEPIVKAVAGPATNTALVEAARGCDVVAIDCPLSWPAPFVRAVTSHHALEAWPSVPPLTSLRHRTTDLVVRETCGLWPVSVSTDKLGATALRDADLQAELAVGAWGGVVARRAVARQAGHGRQT
jgi:hypothetical protein